MLSKIIDFVNNVAYDFIETIRKEVTKRKATNKVFSRKNVDEFLKRKTKKNKRKSSNIPLKKNKKTKLTEESKVNIIKNKTKIKQKG